jgi:hypothetical protein
MPLIQLFHDLLILLHFLAKPLIQQPLVFLQLGYLLLEEQFLLAEPFFGHFVLGDQRLQLGKSLGLFGLVIRLLGEQGGLERVDLVFKGRKLGREEADLVVLGGGFLGKVGDFILLFLVCVF